jgi:hypothetical protein
MLVKNRQNFCIGHLIVQAIGTEQDSVAGLQLKGPLHRGFTRCGDSHQLLVRLDLLLSSKVLLDNMAVGVTLRLLRLQPSRRKGLLDPRVIDCELVNDALSDEIGTAVSRMGDVQAITNDRGGDNRRSHAA